MGESSASSAPATSTSRGSSPSSTGYDGWLVVEQDWVPGPEDEFAEQAEAQARNRRWLSEHAGL